MSDKLKSALQPQPIPQMATPSPGAPAPKPSLDFQPMVETATKEHDKKRGGLSSAMINVIQAVYAQEAQQQGARGIQPPALGMQPGWGGEGR
jgi:hypothetical protein